jgi:predicted flap endonuclease-1-like 5' DNA nuclease
MNRTFKNAIRLAGVAAGLAAAAWAMRDRLLPDPAPPTDTPPKFRTGGGESTDDITSIKGIGPAFAQRLSEAGVSTFATLAAEDAATIAEIANTTEAAAQRWIDDAASHL